MYDFIAIAVAFLAVWLGSIIASGVIAGNKGLSVVGFVFLALFLGPLALLLVLLVPSAQKKSTQATPSLQDAQRQLLSIKQTLSALGKRVMNLEGVIKELLQGQPILEQEPPQELQPAVVKEEAVKTAPSPALATKKEAKEGFEFVFGKYWLNRIGIILCFLGGAFFIGYTFKYLNAFAKILIGYLVSVGFFIWGHFLEKKEQYVKLAAGILGGAWGFLYLSTYAMYYIEATRIITSPIIELWLLAIVSFAAILYNLKHRSWVVTSFTFLLAFITAGLGGIDYSTVIYCTSLTASIVYFSYRLQWYKFLLFAMCGIYLTYIWWLHPHIFSTFLVTQSLSIPVYQFYLSSGILLTSWLFFSLGFFLLKVDDRLRLEYVVRGILINAAFFILLILNELYWVEPHLNLNWDIRFWSLVVLSAVYFIYAYFYRQLKRQELIVATSSIAFTLVAMAAFVKFPRLSVGLFWLIEMAILFTLGIYYKERVFRILARILSILIVFRLFLVDYFSLRDYTIFGLDIDHGIVIFIFAALLFYSLGMLMRNKRIIKNIPGAEARYSCIFFTILGAILFTSTRFLPVRMSFFWISEMLALFLLGLYYKARVYRVLCAIVGVFIVLRLFAVDYYLDREYFLFSFRIEHSMWLFLFATICFYFLRMLFLQQRKAKTALREQGTITTIFVIFGTILITFLYGQKIEGRWLTCVWALEGVGILGIGFLLKDKIFRVSALCVLCLACLRLVFYDLAGVETIYRIIAFIFLGVVSLGASLVYSKFLGRGEEKS